VRHASGLDIRRPGAGHLLFIALDHNPSCGAVLVAPLLPVNPVFPTPAGNDLPAARLPADTAAPVGSPRPPARAVAGTPLASWPRSALIPPASPGCPPGTARLPSASASALATCGAAAAARFAAPATEWGGPGAGRLSGDYRKLPLVPPGPQRTLMVVLYVPNIMLNTWFLSRISWRACRGRCFRHSGGPDPRASLIPADPAREALREAADGQP
jgi:hypothetical protein